jgi:hypothetical protein
MESLPSESLTIPDHSRADWDPEEVTHLLQYLQAHKSEIADSGTFKAKTYTNLLPTLAPLRKSGAVKTVKHCSYKWGMLKQTYNSINGWKQLSGVHWDDIHGCMIDTDAERGVFDAYVKTKAGRLLTPYRNKGWAHFNIIADIYPLGGATGRNTFRGTMAATQARPVPIPCNPCDDNSASTSNHTTAPPAPSIPSSHTAVHTAATDSNIGEKRTFSTISTDLLPDSALPSESSLVASFRSKKKSRSAKSLASSHISPSSEAGTNTNSIAVMGMQGSLNRLTDAVVSSLTMDAGGIQPRASERASNILSDTNEPFSMEERLFMLHYISNPQNATTRDVFTGIVNSDLRAAFVRELYQKYLKNDEEIREA